MIRAHHLWNDTGFELQAGRQYVLRAKGYWWDAFVRCTATGYPSPCAWFHPLENRRRAPSSNWFALIGAIGHDLSTVFEIGAALSLTAPRTGYLSCFANDLPAMYWNNWGAVELTCQPG